MMARRNLTKTNAGKTAARLLAASLVMSQLTGCGFLESLLNKGASGITGSAEITEEVLPEGTSLAGAALPDTEPSVQVGAETLAGKQVQDAAGAKAFLQEMKDEIGFSDISEFSDAASDSTSSTNIYRFTQMAGGLPVEGRGIRVLTDPEGNVIDVNGRYLDPAEIDAEVLISSEDACQAVRDWFAAGDTGESAGGNSASGILEKVQELLTVMKSSKASLLDGVKAVREIFGADGDGSEPESKSGSESEPESGNESDSGSGEVRQIVQGCVICFEDEKAQAAWKTLAFADGGSYQCYVSARDGSVLSVTNLDVHESAVGSGEDNDGKQVEFRTEKRLLTYLLEDAGARVRVVDVEGTKRAPDFCIRPKFEGGPVFYADFSSGSWDAEGTKGFPILLNNQETQDSTGLLDEDFRMVVREGKLAVTDNGTVIYPDVFVEPVFRKLIGHFDVLSDRDNVWENPRAVSVMKHLQETDRYWREVMVRNGWDNRNSPLIFALNAGDTDNSATSIWDVVPENSEPWKVNPLFVTGALKVNADYSVGFNVIAHEFTHAVIFSHVFLGKSYKYAEASSIGEGLADLFSELAEKYIRGDCDWTADGGRNLKDPLVSENPSVFKGTYWLDQYVREARTKDEIKKNDKPAHRNSTVISHMGYLMATGDLKKPAKTEALGAFLTGRLFYNTFPLLEEDMTFADYATRLYEEAYRMYRAEQMSAKQVYCVYRAIEEVGLLPVVESGTVEDLVLEYLSGQKLTEGSVDIHPIERVRIGNRDVDVITSWEGYADKQAELKNDAVRNPGVTQALSDGSGKSAEAPAFYKVTVCNNGNEEEDFNFILRTGSNFKAGIAVTPFLEDEVLYYNYLKNTYGTDESDLVSAYIMDFDQDGRKDLLTVTKGSVILANTPLGPFGIYNGKIAASTFDLTMYQLDEKDNVVRTGTILGAGTVEGHSRGTMAISLVLQDGKPYICGYSTNEDDTTYGARPYVVYEVIDGGGFQYDYVSGITWGQYVMGGTDEKDPNQVAGTYGLDVSGTQLSEPGKYGVLLCEAEADNMHSPQTFTANDYTRVKEGMEKGYRAVKEQLDAMHEEMVRDAKTFEERKERAKDSEALFEAFAEEMKAAGAEPVLDEYITDEDTVTGVYTCQKVDIRVKVGMEDGKLISIGLFADGYPVPDSWFTVKDAVLKTSFAGLDQAKIGQLLGRYRDNFSVSQFDAGPAKILAGNAGTIVLRIEYD